jgi:hypothetical protein
MIADLPSLPALTVCEARIVPYAGWHEASGQTWSFAASATDGSSVTVFGAQHSRDPADAQVAAIAEAFANARPTAVFFEGPDRGLAASAEEAVRTQGESGYARFLAAKAGLIAKTLEPGPAELMASLKTHFDADQVMLFFVLRETARLRDREHLSGAPLDAAVTKLLEKAAPLALKAGLATSITDVASLAAATRKQWRNLDWSALPSAWFSPGEGPAEAKFLPAMNTAVSEARNRHMVRLFTTAAQGGGRVFVVVGRNHVPMIAPALECAFSR